jgi:hypothetical protein
MPTESLLQELETATAAGASAPVSSSVGLMEVGTPYFSTATAASSATDLSGALEAANAAVSAAAASTAAGEGHSLTATLTQAVGKLSGSLEGIDWATPNWNVVIGLFFVMAVFLYGLTLGRDRIIVILVSTYMALAVVSNMPTLTFMDGAYAVKTLAFVLLFLLLLSLTARTALYKIFSSLSMGSTVQVVLFTVLQAGLLVSIILSFLPPEASQSLMPFFVNVFTSPAGRFGWIVAPILAMVVFTGREEVR